MSIITDEKSELKVAQITEAVSRMKKLELCENVIKEFLEERKLNKSCYCKIGRAKIGALYWLTDEEQKMVREIEDEYNIVVYHVIESNTNLGRLLTMLYVGESSDEWEFDDELFDSNCQYAYVKNLDDDMCSEFGTINYQKACGGLIRTA